MRQNLRSLALDGGRKPQIVSAAFGPPRFLKSLNRRRWYVRWPVKWAIFGLAYTIVCFPYPRLAIRHIIHWSNPNAMIEPDAPSLQPMAAEMRAGIPPGLPVPKVLAWVEDFVYQKVPYEWDWNTWGMADYLPTLDEVIRAGKEDCDGRAVVAASLLRNLGYDARLVTDFAHVWVSTPYGDTMGPGKTKTIEVTEKGFKVDYRGILRLPRILGYGIAVFPFERELILLGVLWLLLLGRAGVGRAMICLGLLVAGLILLRYGAANYRGPLPLFESAGALLLVAGTLLMALKRWPFFRSSERSELETTKLEGNAL